MSALQRYSLSHCIVFIISWAYGMFIVLISYVHWSLKIARGFTADRLSLHASVFFFASQLLPEHRPLTILRHSARSCALLSASLQLSFMLPSSFSTVLFHVFFGLPVSRQPLGVHLRASHASVLIITNSARAELVISTELQNHYKL